MSGKSAQIEEEIKIKVFLRQLLILKKKTNLILEVSICLFGDTTILCFSTLDNQEEGRTIEMGNL